MSSRSTFTVRGNANGIGDTNTRRDIEGLRSLGDLDARDRGLHARLNRIGVRWCEGASLVSAPILEIVIRAVRQSYDGRRVGAAFMSW